MRSVRLLLVALLSSAATLLVVAGISVASRARASRTVTVKQGDLVVFARLDLACSFAPHDPDGKERGPVIYCNRYSVNRSRALGASRHHFWLYNASGRRVVSKLARNP